MKNSIGPRSNAALREIESLTAKRDAVSQEVTNLTETVTDRQAKLDAARAQGLIAKVDKSQIAAFEVELKELQAQLAEERSTLAGLTRMIEEKSQALQRAKEEDARESLRTKTMARALSGLAENTAALEECRAAILQALEAGAVSLLKKVGPRRQQWDELIKERGRLYGLRKQALGPGAAHGEDPYYRMQKDPFAVHPFGNPDEIPAAVALAELLRPLLTG